jgi:hypothetical protein
MALRFRHLRRVTTTSEWLGNPAHDSEPNPGGVVHRDVLEPRHSSASSGEFHFGAPQPGVLTDTYVARQRPYKATSQRFMKPLAFRPTAADFHNIVTRIHGKR